MLPRSVSTWPETIGAKPGGRRLSQLLVSVSREYGSVIAGVGLTRALTFLASVILARSLSLAGFGAYSFAYTITTLVAQLPNMLDASFVRNYAIDPSESSKRALLRAHLYIKVALLAVISLLSLALARPFSSAVLNKPHLETLVIAALLGGGFFSLFNSALAFHQARKRFLAYSVTFLAVNLLAFAALLVFLAVGRATPLGAMLTFNTFPYAIAAICASLWLLSRSTTSEKGLGKTSQLLRFSGWLIPAGPLYILLQRVDLIILSRYASYRVLGLYGAAVVLSSVVSLFTSNLQVIFLPKAAESFRKAEGLHDYLFQAFAASSAIAVVAMGGLLTAPWILRVALGAQYVAAALPLRVLFLGYVLVAMTPPLTALLYAAGRTKLIFGERLLELAVALALCLILVPRYAATGAATSISLAYLLGGVYVLVNVRRVLREPELRTVESGVGS